MTRGFVHGQMWRPRISSDLLVPTYMVGVVGAFLQISGGIWDVSSHIMGIVETFFTVPHLVLYAGVLLCLVASLTGVLLRRRLGSSVAPGLFTGLRVSLVGGGLQVIAGPFDLWWHSTYGFDPHLFTPSHSLLITGLVLNGVGMGIAATRLVQAGRAGIGLGRFSPRTRWLELLGLVSLCGVWLGLNGLVYLVTDIDGLNYTFHLGQSWVDAAAPVSFVLMGLLLAGVASLLFIVTKKTFPWNGAVSIVAVMVAVVVGTANLGFRAWYQAGIDPSEGARIAGFLPVYFSFLVPVVLLDFVSGRELGRVRLVLFATLVAPFASYLDGFYSLILWVSRPYLVPTLLVPMLAAGTIAALFRTRFVNLFGYSGPRLTASPGMK